MGMKAETGWKKAGEGSLQSWVGVSGAGLELDCCRGTSVQQR